MTRNITKRENVDHTSAGAKIRKGLPTRVLSLPCFAGTTLGFIVGTKSKSYRTFNWIILYVYF